MSNYAQLFDAAAARREKCDACNAILAIDMDGWRASLEDASLKDKPLAGMPIAVKDNICVSGFAMTGATAALADFKPAADAPAIKRLRDAGGVIVAKTNLHELAFGITCNNAHTGPVKNPHNPQMIAGGSSGGSAVAVATGLVPGAIGSDTGGSCRIPPALCGVFGMRPTTGRVGDEGAIPLSPSRDTLGPFAANVADLALLDAVLAGESDLSLAAAEASSLKLGVPRGYLYENLDAELAAVIEAALEAVASAGVTLVEADIPKVGELTNEISFPMVFYETARHLPEFLQSYGTGVSMEELMAQVKSPDVKGVLGLLTGEAATPEELYQQIMAEKIPALQATYRDYFASNGLDAAIYPTTPLPARPLGHDETVELNGAQVPTFPTFIRNCDPGSCAGVPSISIPAGKTASGLPVGIMLEGPASSDRRLLGIAAAIEAALG